MAEHSCRPQTPSPHPSQHLQDSPFSDYYTDAALSPSQPPLSSMQKTLLLQLTQARDEILHREPDFHVAEQLHEALNTINGLPTAPDAQSKPDLEDSGLFLEDDDEGLGISTKQEHVESVEDTVEDGDLSPKPLDAQQWEDVVEDMTKMSSELRQRYAEIKEVNALLTTKLDKANDEIKTFRSINESMRSDLLFDRSELQFLKLQLKALEEKVSPHAAEHDTHLFETIQRWKQDWRDLDERARICQEAYSGEKIVEKLGLCRLRDSTVEVADMASAVKTIDASQPSLGMRLPTAVPGSIFASPYPPSPSPSRSDSGSSDLHAADLPSLDSTGNDSHIGDMTAEAGERVTQKASGEGTPSAELASTSSDSDDRRDSVLCSFGMDASAEDLVESADESVPQTAVETPASDHANMPVDSLQTDKAVIAPKTPGKAAASQHIRSISDPASSQPGLLSFFWRGNTAPKRYIVPKAQLNQPSKFWDWMSNATGMDAYDDFYDDYRESDD